MTFAAGDSLVVSHHLPVDSQIVDASPERPYVAAVVTIDLAMARSLSAEVRELQVEGERHAAFEVGGSDASLVDAVGRLFDLLEHPLEARILRPMLLREIHFRLLVAPHGGTLRQLLRRGGHADRIARAIARIRQSYANPLPIEELARVSGMSASSFHEHFKSLTATTPLQYQKDLRLLEARRLLREGERNVTEVALEVGYGSPTQFSREYSRKFGHAPRVDLPR